MRAESTSDFSQLESKVDLAQVTPEQRERASGQRKTRSLRKADCKNRPRSAVNTDKRMQVAGQSGPRYTASLQQRSLLHHRSENVRRIL